ncbi:hypothetical protein HDU76_012179, partial [Blyttiomyces sp. JEL0837]
DLFGNTDRFLHHTGLTAGDSVMVKDRRVLMTMLWCNVVFGMCPCDEENSAWAWMVESKLEKSDCWSGVDLREWKRDMLSKGGFGVLKVHKKFEKGCGSGYGYGGGFYEFFEVHVCLDDEDGVVNLKRVVEWKLEARVGSQVKLGVWVGGGEMEMEVRRDDERFLIMDDERKTFRQYGFNEKGGNV